MSNGNQGNAGLRNGDVLGEFPSGGGDPRPSSTTAPEAPARMSVGRNGELPRKLVEQAVIKHFGDLCRSRGIAVPADPLDLLNRARVYFLDDAGKPIALSKVMIAWEE